ncbi:invasion associated locus B family protein [Pseudorhodobacter sp.]|uniref:invasion associated locus B family protein n=1 Tax=Pseudorhodobacter sp. TaxID=1934400 RepID=UPI002AFECAFE|nr:invasion associated locus B family protein [Pseudorhodobacter sp.]
MPLTKTAQLLATTLCLFIGTAAFAQDAATTPEAPAPETTAPETTAPAADAAAAPAAVAPGLSMGKEEGAANDGIGSSYSAGTFGAWEQTCIKTEDGSDPCQLVQLLKDGGENPVAQFIFASLPADHPARPKAVAGADIIVPLGTQLTAGLSLSVDGGTTRKYPFSWCEQIGCIAQIGFTQAELDGFKKGKEAKLTLVQVFSPDKVELTISLAGFTAGFDAVNKANGN